MRVILFLIRKEFLQIFRNKSILPLILVMPVIQLFILSYAADFEIRNVRVFWMDDDQSTSSRMLLQKIQASDYFQLVDQSFSPKAADLALVQRKTDLVFHIPQEFEHNLFREGHADIQLTADAIDGTKAGLGTYYANLLIQDFSRDWLAKYGSNIHIQAASMPSIVPTYSFWYNQHLNYKTFMVPGILVMLVTMIGAFISAMNIVREKELGTIEQLNVTPIRKYQFIAGKLIPLWILGLFIFTVGLVVAKLAFHVPIIGSLFLIYGFTAIYLVMILGLGMLISTFTNTQQQAMFISWFFLVIFILMSGLFTPIENMPPWAQNLTLINPIRYFIEVIRLVMLKGAVFQDVSLQFVVIGLYAIIINGLAIWNYRKTV